MVEMPYYGDVIRHARRLENEGNLNDNILVGNSISVVCDQYAVDHFARIKYVEWAGVLWSVSSIEVRYPRLILTLGKVYNGPTP